MEINMSRSTTTTPPAAMPSAAGDIGVAGRVETDFVDALLAALTEMAVRSPRRQADLAVALRRSGMEASEEMLAAGLALLEQDGCVENMVQLADGGVLLSVTAHGIEYLSQTSRRYVLDFSGK